jgi:hypothetical protein
LPSVGGIAKINDNTKLKRIKVKKHKRLAQSIFRVGLDLLQDGLLNFGSVANKLKIITYPLSALSLY